MTFIYNLAFSIFALGYLPFFLLKLRQAENPKQLLRERSGRPAPHWHERFGRGQVIWIHAVSVGEVMAARHFIERFRESAPDYQIFLTTVTPTGQRIAKTMESDRITTGYFPFDFSWAMRAFFECARPQALLLMETEIWPNLLTEAARAGVPVGILNARLSERSAKRYGRFAKLFRPLFNKLAFVLAQSEQDAARFLKAGVPSGRVHVLGNMKIDNTTLAADETQLCRELRAQWSIAQNDLVWIAGSTHPGEEKTAVEILRALRPEFPLLKLIVAPRHIERSAALAKWIRGRGLTVRMSSSKAGGVADVLIVDQLGILKNLYAMADLVFVGGSLARRGGQNPIEPAVFRRAILHGPHIFNFEPIYRALSAEGGAIAVRDAGQLRYAVSRLLHSEEERRLLGARAWSVVYGLQGATERHLEWVLGFLSPAQQERNTNEFDAKLFPSAGGRA